MNEPKEPKCYQFWLPHEELVGGMCTGLIVVSLLAIILLPVLV